jgi:hypothetical protein
MYCYGTVSKVRVDRIDFSEMLWYHFVSAGNTDNTVVGSAWN